jgi:hypothetical protein
MFFFQARWATKQQFYREIDEDILKLFLEI